VTISVEAVYENGVLKPAQPLPLAEHERVRLAVHRSADGQSASDVVKQTYGLIGWTGDHETLERLLAEAEELS
jgi:predicted DNA-binding antitoxin AbrB/MazE fold protein